MRESPPKSETPRNTYGWNEEELEMDTISECMWIGHPKSGGSAERVGAKWDNENKRVIVRGAGGFTAEITGFTTKPETPQQMHAIQRFLEPEFQKWAENETDKNDNNPLLKTWH